MRIARLAAALTLLLPHSAFAGVAAVPSLRPGISAPASFTGVLRFPSLGIASSNPNLRGRPSLSLSSIPFLTLPTLNLKPAPAVLPSVRREASPTTRLKAFGKALSQEDGTTASLSAEAFDGSAGPGFEAPLPAPAAYPPEITEEFRLRDPRYAALIQGSAKILFERRPARGSDQEPRSPAHLLWMAFTFDKDLHAHLLRVGLLSGRIALEMGLSMEEAEEIAWAATFHDIGKVRFDINTVIHKNGKLDAGEQRIMQEHAEYGAKELLRAQRMDPRVRSPAAQVALMHHEKLDGSGYPRGLEGDRVSRAARITAVADFLDALMEVRSYKRGMRLEEALKIIRSRARLYDPDAMSALLRLLDAAVPGLDAVAAPPAGRRAG